MKPPYLDKPGRWQYAPRVDQTPAAYACAIERAKLSGYSWHDWAILAVAVVVIGLIYWAGS